ncbi:MAG: hypothetical protein OEV99_07175 [Nitrospira sp.]|nr:hypothetical protein [Nitrospira sp.]MDH4369613.1 hypothetical protein [Nitrospira sp.]MDH5348343.1 hypothetical protein [Nitrospira sp.]MDH5497132.1 hypothetical protein [Nitrospira sp.]MDH5725865.1 hypothetical protein [Nitrospira sp.]
MRTMVLLMFLLYPMTVHSAEPDTSSLQKEPRLYDHYLSLQRLQESLAGRSLEEQARLQPQINRAEHLACEQVRRERQEQVPKEDYRRQGGDQFLVFAQQLEQYCLSIR